MLTVAFSEAFEQFKLTGQAACRILSSRNVVEKGVHPAVLCHSTDWVWCSVILPGNGQQRDVNDRILSAGDRTAVFYASYAFPPFGDGYWQVAAPVLILTLVACPYFNTSAIASHKAFILPGVIPATLMRPEPTI